MFRIRPNRIQKGIRTIEQEVAQTKARYARYLSETSNNFSAKRSNVEIKDPHTMAGDAYWDLREHINPINEIAKKTNKEIVFEDARVLIRDDEFSSANAENYLSSKILLTVKDKGNGVIKTSLIDRLQEQEFMKKIFEAIKNLIWMFFYLSPLNTRPNMLPAYFIRNINKNDWQLYPNGV